MLDLKNTISSLRREAGYTQERLAQMLGVTVAAVSKWECGNAYPDITLLPQIADIFGVSIDMLMGYDRWKNADIPDIITKADEAAWRGDHDEAIENISKALARYPGSIQLIFALARHKLMKAQTVTGDYRNTLFSEAEVELKTVQNSDDVEFRGWAVHFLTTIAVIRGDLDTAAQLNSTILPPKGVSPCSDRGVILMKKGHDEGNITEMQELILGSIFEYVSLTEWLFCGYYERGDTEAALAEALRLTKVLREFEESGLFFEDLSIAHEAAASCFALKKDFEKCLLYLADAAEYAKKAETADEPKIDIFGVLNTSYKTARRTNVSASLRQTLCSSNERKEYDPLRSDGRFKDILASLGG